MLGTGQSKQSKAADLSVWEAFSRAADKFPKRNAIETDSGTINYVELQSNATLLSQRLAAELSAILLKRHRVVAICISDPIQTITIVLALTRLNITYVILDYADQSLRASQIINDCDPFAVIVDRCAAKGVLPHNLAEAIGNRRTIDLSASFCIKKQLAVFETQSESRAVDAMYILYTSGSTGKPKGVVQSEKNLIYFIKTFCDRLKVTETDRLTLVSALMYDAALMDIFSALLNGATLCIFDIRKRGASCFSEWVEQEQITVYHSTPTVFRLLGLSKLQQKPYSTVRAVVLGGELVRQEDYELFRKLCKDEALFVNGYGPSESTLATQCVLTKTCNVTGNVPIGTAVEGTAIILLNKDGSPSLDEEGEIGIASDHLARYWKLPSLNDSRFITDFSSGTTIFRTGDFGKYGSDGQLYFVGRAAGKLSIHGIIVEEAEIANHLLAIDGIEDLVLREWLDDSLAVWVLAPDDSKGVTPRSIRTVLKNALPQYMWPSKIHVVKKFPLRANGKVNFQALTTSDSEKLNVKKATQSYHERKIIQIISEVLGISIVDPSLTFLDLGGDSLGAMSVIFQINNEFYSDLKLIDLFGSLSVSEIANRIKARSIGRAEQERLVIQKFQSGDSVIASDVQRGIWSACAVYEDTRIYNVLCLLHIYGELDKKRLERSIAVVANSHSILRSVYHVEGEELMRTTLPHIVKFTIESCQLGAESELDSFTRNCADHEFHLEKDLLIRASLAEMNARSCFLMINIHHINVDALSLNSVVEKVFAVYDSLQQGACAAEIQNWEECCPPLLYPLNQHVSQKSKSFWKGLLDNALANHRLPFASVGEPNDERPSTDAESISIKVSQAAKLSLRKIGAEERVTQYMLLLAAFSFVASRYFSEGDFLVGTPIGHSTSGDGAIVGPRLNTLPLRIQVNENKSFRSLVIGIKRLVLNVVEHGEIPLAQLNKLLPDERSALRVPFGLFFSYERRDAPRRLSSELLVKRSEVPTARAKFDFSLSMLESDAELSGEVIYRTELYDRKYIEEFASNFLLVLDNLDSLCDTKLVNIDILNNVPSNDCMGSQFRLLNPRGSILDRISAQSRVKPHDTAIIWSGGKISYSQLESKACQLAQTLRGKGVRAGDRVAMLLGATPTLPACILALWKLAAVPVPIDGELPIRRAQTMLERLSARLIVSDLADWVGEEGVMELPPDEITLEPSTLKSMQLDDAEAYVIFTSGTTGEPKGAINLHRGLVNRFNFMDERFSTRPRTVLQSTNHCYDSSIWELFWALTNGGQVVMGSELVRTFDYEALARTIWRHSISMVDVIPAFLTGFGAFLAENTQHLDLLKSLEHIVVGGESLCSDDLKHVQKHLPKVIITNAFGPTETSIGMIFYEIPNPCPSVIPIGKPIRNTAVLILDTSGNQVPFGATGELYIGGLCVGAGYVNREDLTSKAFVTLPNGRGRGAVWYRTGDLVKYGPSGDLMYCTRIDRQIKRYGHRIELSDIERVASEVGCVRRAVAVNLYRDGLSQIVIFIVPSRRVSTVQLQNRVTANLPYYMRPDEVLLVRELPRADSGKIDYGELRKIAGEMVRESRQRATDCKDGIEIVRELLCEILGVQTVDSGGNFFDLGLTSLSAVRFQQLLQQRASVSVRIIDIFQFPNVNLLGEHIRSLQANDLAAS